MLLIVYKKMAKTIQCAQARRIVCDNCQEAFSYLRSSWETAATAGLPVVSSSERMRDQVITQFENVFKYLAETEQKGKALCPHCHYYQEWMLKGRSIGKGLLILPMFLVSVVASAALFASVGLPPRDGMLLGVLAAAVVLTVLLYKLLPTSKAGPHQPKQDYLTMKDAELVEHYNRASSENREPIVAWHERALEKPKVELIPLGLLDTTSEPILPEGFSSDAYVERLIRGTIG